MVPSMRTSFAGIGSGGVEAVKPADLVREPADLDDRQVLCLLRRSQGRPAASQHWQTRFSPSHRLQMGRAGLTPRMCPGRHKAGLPEQDLVSSDQGMSCSHREAAQPLLLGVVIGSKIRLDQLPGRALPSVPVAGPSDRRHQKGQKKISILSQNGPRPLRVYSFRPHEAPTQPSSIHGKVICSGHLVVHRLIGTTALKQFKQGLLLPRHKSIILLRCS